MGLNTLGLGIVLSMRDMASVPATRAAGALGQLDRAAQDFSNNFNSAIATAFEGMNLLSAGVLLAGAPAAFIKSTFETQEQMAALAAVGIKKLDMVQQAAVDFTNNWAGTTQQEFLETSEYIKSGIYSLSDEAVAAFTNATGIVGRATKSNMNELTELMPIMYGILRDTMPEADDLQFIDSMSGALAEAVVIYRSSGKYMGDAFSQASSLATSMGVSMQEQLAVVGELQQTMTGSEAGTKFRAFMRSVAKAEENKVKLGIDIDFAGADGMMLPVFDVLDNLKKQYGESLTLGSAEELRKLFGSREAVSAITNLLPKVDKLREDTKLLEAAMGEGLAHATNIAATATNNIADSWLRLTQRANNLSQAIGETLIPVFKPLVDVGGNVLIALQNLVKANPFIIRLVASMASLGGAILAGVGVLFILSAILQIINGSFLLMRTRLTILRVEFAKMAMTIWPFIVLVGLLYAAFKSNFMGIGDAVTNALNKIKSFFNAVSQIWSGLRELFSNFDGISDGMISEELYNALNEAGLWDITKKLFMLGVRLYYLWQGIKEGFNSFWEGMVIIMTPIWGIINALIIQPFKKLIGFLAKYFPSLDGLLTPNQESVNKWQLFGRGLGVVLGIFTLLQLPLKLLGSLWKIVSKLGFAFKPLIKIAPKIFGAFKWAFLGIAKMLMGMFAIPLSSAMLIVAAVAVIVFLIIRYWEQVGPVIIGVFQTIIGVVGMILMSIGAIVFALISTIVLGVIAFVGTVGLILFGIIGFVIGVAYGIVAVFQSALYIVAGVFGIIFEVIKGIIQTFLAIAKAIITGDFSGLGETLKGIWTGVWNNIGDIVTFAVEGIKGVWNGVTSFFTGIWDSLQTAAGKFFDWIGDKFSWVFAGLDKVSGGLDWAGDLVKKGWDKVTFWDNEKPNINQPIRSEGKAGNGGFQSYAKGGVFNGSSIIEIGEQPGVAEAAIPLSGMYMRPFAEEIANIISGYSVEDPKPQVPGSPAKGAKPYNNTINNFFNTQEGNEGTDSVTNNENITNNNQQNETKTVIEVPVYLDGRQISKVVAEHLDREKRR